MKKSIAAAILFLLVFAGGFNFVAPQAVAQSFTIQQLVQFFISLGIIPTNQIAAAEKFVGLPITVANPAATQSVPVPSTTPTTTPTQTTSTPTISSGGRINFNLYAVALDGINIGQDITNQLAQAAAFIAANSRFNIVYTVVSSNTPHTYAKYDCNYYGTFESQGCVALAAAQLDPNFVSSLPVADGYMFFYDLNGLHPLDGGDTYGAPYGILKEGLQRTQSSMAVDAGWWMSTDPNYTGESIILHELDNQIDSTLQKNYSCAPLTYPTDGTTGVPAEKERLSAISQSCYTSVVNNPSSI